MIKRRTFIAGLGSAAAWPVVARGQEAAMPVIGFLDSRSPEALVDRLRGFRQGLKETGYVESDNLAIVYRWAENQFERLPQLAGDLVRRRVAVVVASGGLPVVFAAQAASTTIPIVGIFAEDPVRLGLVTSLARPNGNLTGVNLLNAELVAKQLGLLREIVPRSAVAGVFVNPSNPTSTDTTLREVETAARSMGVQINVLRASSSQDIDMAFATFSRERVEALLIAQDAFFASRRIQLVQLAAYHRLPTIYAGREYPEIGGLMSYGSNIIDAYRIIAGYVGRIFKGAKPADLPVVQASKFELVINAQTAKMLGLEIPPSLLARADEIIE